VTVKRLWSAALAGVLAGALILGVAELAAGLMTRLGLAGGTPSPVVAVGGAFVDRTPAWLKNFAVNTFGTNDKTALFVGMAVVLTALCAALGIVGERRHTAGLVGFVVVGALGAAAVLSRPNAGPLDVVPTMLGVLVGLWALQSLWRLRSAADEPGATGFERRRLLVGSAGIAAAAATTAAVGRGVGGRGATAAAARAGVTLPPVARPVTVPAGADLRLPGLTPFVVPNGDFYRIDTALIVPQLDTAGWRLRVHGLVEREVTLTWAELLARPMQQALVTLTCVSNEVGGNLAGNAVWTGWPIRELLAMAGPRPEADMVLSTSSDGWTAGTPLTALTDDRNALLAVAMNGQPLPVEHGFPVRMVVPGLYGYVSATKWVVDLKVTRFQDDTAYWTPRGWSERGPVKTESRIDVPRSGDRVTAGRVAVAGVAWAQHRGVKAVEVRIDHGPWQHARLAAEPTIDSWRQWVLEWDATRGNHTISVRATDGTGQVQTAEPAPPEPDGATGWHTITVSVA
jgi:DMSO/TMAO reductase YedYZ molybdopterin-dependent catalytic subunit